MGLPLEDAALVQVTLDAGLLFPFVAVVAEDEDGNEDDEQDDSAQTRADQEPSVT